MVMIRTFSIVALLLCLAASTLAFTVRPPSVATPDANVVIGARHKNTKLFSTEEESANADEQPEGEEQHADEDHVLPSESDTDILNSPAFLRRKIDVLQSDIEKAEEDLANIQELVAEGKEEWGAQLDDLQTEYEKIRERMAEQNKGGNDEATVLVARQMLGLLDNYDRAFGVLTAETEEEKEIEDAYRATYNKILGIFEELGVTEVETVGTEFDYEVHQAVMQRPSDDYDEGIVCEELAKGFVLGDTLIRAAMVSVAA